MWLRQIRDHFTGQHHQTQYQSYPYQQLPYYQQTQSNSCYQGAQYSNQSEYNRGYNAGYQASQQQSPPTRGTCAGPGAADTKQDAPRPTLG